MNAEIQGHIGILTKLHAQADALRADLGLEATVVDTASPGDAATRHLRAL